MVTHPHISATEALVGEGPAGDPSLQGGGVKSPLPILAACIYSTLCRGRTLHHTTGVSAGNLGRTSSWILRPTVGVTRDST